MKVLVMSERVANDRINGYEELLDAEIQLGTFDAEEISAMRYRLAALKSFTDSMTPINIPDGCVLAVVENFCVPTLYWHESGTRREVFHVEDEPYRRVIQEVRIDKE